MLSARAYSFHQKSRLAISLSWIGGYTNAVMVVAAGMFVSNMTGSSTSMGTAAAHGQWRTALLFAFLIAAFWLGAVASAFMTEGARRRGVRSKYVLPMAVEAALLGVLALALQRHHHVDSGSVSWFWLTGIGCFAMGLQNATVTEISGAVVRTTHLTGVITDLGLEGVRFFNWYRDLTRGRRWARAGRVLRVSQRHPAALRLLLLASIFGSFVFGTVAGALAFLHLPDLAMVAPVAFLMWIILVDFWKPIADVRELDLLGDPELKLHGIVHSLLPPELGLWRLSHRRLDRVHHPPDFHQWAEHLREQWRVIVLAVSPLTHFNANSAQDLRDIAEKLHREGRDLIISGITPKQYKVLAEGGLVDALETENFCPDLEFAIARGIELVRELTGSEPRRISERITSSGRAPVPAHSTVWTRNEGGHGGPPLQTRRHPPYPDLSTMSIAPGPTVPRVPAAFHVMTKPVGPICNLDCTYCFYLEKEKLYPDTEKWRMPDDVLEEYVRQYITHQDVPTISFAWQGGEPTLLGVDYFRKVVAFQRKYANGKQIDNAFQTNGTLLDDEWCEFLSANRFLVGLSIDGPRELHDRYRVDKQQRPTFDAVVRGLEFLKKHKTEFNTLTVVNRANSQKPLDVYRFLKEIGSGYIQFIPLVERKASPGRLSVLQLPLAEPPLPGEPHDPYSPVTPWSVEAKQYGEFLCAIFDEWVRKDVGRTFVQIFDVALGHWAGAPGGLCVFAEKCGTALAMEHNGDLYSCDHYVYPRYKLGNVMNRLLGDMVFSAQQRKFGSDKSDSLPRYCRTCEVRFACNGECPKHRFTRTPDGEEGLNYLCPAYKRFFNHVDPYMKTMADLLRAKQPPALIMRMLAEEERAKRQPAPVRGQPGRNDPCPCGSGKKFKKCHGA